MSEQQEVEFDQFGIEQAFIDAVLDTVVPADVAELGLRVRDVVTIARWLAPVHRSVVTAAADACCTCHTGDGRHEDWCVTPGLLGMVTPPAGGEG